MAKESVASLRTREYDVLRALLRELRESRGMSQEALSTALGRTITYVGKVELGTRRLDVIELMEICRVLDQDPAKVVATLASRTEKQRPPEAERRRSASVP